MTGQFGQLAQPPGQRALPRRLFTLPLDGPAMGAAAGRGEDVAAGDLVPPALALGRPHAFGTAIDAAEGEIPVVAAGHEIGLAITVVRPQPGWIDRHASRRAPRRRAGRLDLPAGQPHLATLARGAQFGPALLSALETFHLALLSAAAWAAACLLPKL